MNAPQLAGHKTCQSATVPYTITIRKCPDFKDKDALTKPEEHHLEQLLASAFKASVLTTEQPFH